MRFPFFVAVRARERSDHYLAPGRAGDVLVAEAVEQALAGKTGVYDVVVTDQDGRKIALFRGKSHRVAGHVVPVDAAM